MAPVMKVIGTMVLIGPILSARMFGSLVAKSAMLSHRAISYKQVATYQSARKRAAIHKNDKILVQVRVSFTHNSCSNREDLDVEVRDIETHEDNKHRAKRQVERQLFEGRAVDESSAR